MTIDEAIAHAREVAEIQRNNDKLNKTLGKSSPYYNTDCIKCAEEHEQIAEWLEELKMYKEVGTVEGYKSAIECYNEEYTMRKSNKQYNKAIDDFERIMCEELKDYIDHKDYMCVGLNLHKFTRDLAEQLKVGE